ncbi:kallikrein-13 isoform X1 [Diceros bicornis minor]|uniref:kallikrein-13 isoform X1 n=1 Tax=Diceros bicornis minor TaxID=77932 RepID=UPI0026ED79DC|nr:kallikrein-13 isoform X1 [Diceros bicornis minor]
MWPLAAMTAFLTVTLSGGISQEFPKILNNTNGTSGFLPGGYTCLPHSQPWQAALLVRGRLLCGGVLVHPKWVLTAAHCLKDKYRVYLGKHALGHVEAGEQVREVVHSIPHPRYQISPTHLNHDHDIMLLELQSPVNLTSHIRVLPLSHNDGLPPGTCCRVSGWGTTTSPQVSFPQTLQCANIQLRSDEECRQVYPGKITPNMLCAGAKEGGKDSCEVPTGPTAQSCWEDRMKDWHLKALHTATSQSMEKQHDIVKNLVSEARLPEFESQLCHLFKRTTYSLSPCLSFPMIYLLF